MKKNKIYPNDKKILLHLALQEKKMNWLNKKDFSMNEKTFWNRVKYLEDCGYVGVIRNAGLKNLYHLTELGHKAIMLPDQTPDITAQIFDLTDFSR